MSGIHDECFHTSSGSYSPLMGGDRQLRHDFLWQQNYAQPVPSCVGTEEGAAVVYDVSAPSNLTSASAVTAVMASISFPDSNAV